MEEHLLDKGIRNIFKPDQQYAENRENKMTYRCVPPSEVHVELSYSTWEDIAQAINELIWEVKTRDNR